MYSPLRNEIKRKYIDRVCSSVCNEEEDFELILVEEHLFEHALAHLKRLQGWLVVDCKGLRLGETNGTLDILVVIDHNQQIFLFDMRVLGISRLSNFDFLFRNSKAVKIFFDCRGDVGAFQNICDCRVDIFSDLSVLYHRMNRLDDMQDITKVMADYGLMNPPVKLRMSNESRTRRIHVGAEKEKMQKRWERGRTGIWESRPISCGHLRYACLNAILTHRLYLFYKRLVKMNVIRQSVIDENRQYSDAHSRFRNSPDFENSRMPLVHHIPHTHCLLQNLAKRIKEVKV